MILDSVWGYASFPNTRTVDAQGKAAPEAGGGSFINSKQNGGVDYPTIAFPGRGNATGGATLRPSVIGTALPLQPKTAQMAQKKKRFVPSVLAVPVGSAVSFPDFDPIFHNAFSNFAGQVFDVGLYSSGTDQKVPFRRAGIVRVFCNIHPTMTALIFHRWKSRLLVCSAAYFQPNFPLPRFYFSFAIR